MEGQAFLAVVKLVRAMRDNGRHINFICLTGTMLSNDDASALASALNSLADRDAVSSASQESQEIPESAETCSAPGAGSNPAEPVHGQPDMNTLHLILRKPSLPLLTTEGLTGSLLTRLVMSLKQEKQQRLLRRAQAGSS